MDLGLKNRPKKCPSKRPPGPEKRPSKRYLKKGSFLDPKLYDMKIWKFHLWTPPPGPCFIRVLQEAGLEEALGSLLGRETQQTI